MAHSQPDRPLYSFLGNDRYGGRNDDVARYPAFFAEV
jgi:hypothetical protein